MGKRVKSRECSLRYCDRPVYSHGLCFRHYQAARRNDGTPVGPSGVELFIEVEKLTGMLQEINGEIDNLIYSSPNLACPYCKETLGLQHTPECVVSRMKEYLSKKETVDEQQI